MTHQEAEALLRAPAKEGPAPCSPSSKREKDRQTEIRSVFMYLSRILTSENDVYILA